jgi:hypothetical protein
MHTIVKEQFFINPSMKKQLFPAAVKNFLPIYPSTAPLWLPAVPVID